MKTKILILVMLLTGTVNYLFADNQLEITAKIRHITVYTQNAKISCDAKASVPAGFSTVVVTGLPSTIDANSIQARFFGGVRIMSVSFRLNYLTEIEKTKDYKVLQDSLEKLNYDWNSLKNQVEVLQNEENLINQNKKLSDAKGFTAIDLKNLADFYRSRLNEIRTEIQRLSAKQLKLSEKINRIKKQIDDLNQLKNKPTGEIVLEVAANTAVLSEIDLSYVTTGVSWSPVYDLKSEGINKDVELVYKAAVVQNTGIDWKNVKLTISTGNPSINNSRPILYPRYLSYYNPNNMMLRQDKRSQMMSNMAMPPSANLDGIKVEDLSLGNEFTVTENQLNVEFEIDIPYNIPSDNTSHIVEMRKVNIPATYEYHTVPILDKGAFLLAKLTDWGKLNLLPGNANLFFEDSYIGQSFIDPRTTSDTLLLSFGRDEKIVVKREKMLDLTSTKYIGSSKKDLVAFEITIRNTKNTTVKIEVLDQLPLTNTTEIEVELIEYSGAQYTKDIGKLLWKLELKPNETKKIKFQYSVKYPKDKVVIGI